ncbi:hypothetical protein Tco_0836133 [Tanacetum coccineum]
MLQKMINLCRAFLLDDFSKNCIVSQEDNFPSNYWVFGLKSFVVILDLMIQISNRMKQKDQSRHYETLQASGEIRRFGQIFYKIMIRKHLNEDMDAAHMVSQHPTSGVKDIMFVFMREMEKDTPEYFVLLMLLASLSINTVRAEKTVVSMLFRDVEEEPVKKMSKKYLLKLDEELALKLQAEEDKEERLARE